MDTPQFSSRSGIIIPPSPFSHSCEYTATVDPNDSKRVNIHLSGRTSNGLKELEILSGKATLSFDNVSGGYFINAAKYASSPPDSFHWSFPVGGVESHFIISDGEGNPFTLKFTKSTSNDFELECDFVVVFGSQYDYEPSRTRIYIDYPMAGNGVFRDTFVEKGQGS